MSQWLPILGGNGGVDVSNGLEGQIYFSKGAASEFGPPPDTWSLVDVTQFGIPKDAKCIDVQGILIITMGSTPGWCSIQIAFRHPGDESVTTRGSYCMQTVANTNDGMRSNAASVVTLVDGKFEWSWFWVGPPQLGWPLNPSVAASIGINRWMR